MRVGDVIKAMTNDAIYRMIAVASNKVAYMYFLQPASFSFCIVPLKSNYDDNFDTTKSSSLHQPCHIIY